MKISQRVRENFYSFFIVKKWHRPLTKRISASPPDLVLYHPRIHPPYRYHHVGQQVFHEATLATKTLECCNESDHFAENGKERKVYKYTYVTGIIFVLGSITSR